MGCRFSWRISADATLALIYNGKQTVHLISLTNQDTRAAITVQFVDPKLPQPGTLYFANDSKTAFVFDDVEVKVLDCSNGEIISCLGE